MHIYALLGESFLHSRVKKKPLCLCLSLRSVDRSAVALYKIEVSYLGLAPLYCTPLHVQVPSEPPCFTPWRLGLGELTWDVALASALSGSNRIIFLSDSEVSCMSACVWVSVCIAIHIYNMYEYVCMHMCVYVCIYTMCVYLYTYIYIQIYIHTVCVGGYVCVYIYYDQLTCWLVSVIKSQTLHCFWPSRGC